MKLTTLTLLVAAAVPVSSTYAQTLFSDNFDADHTANWTLNGGPSDEAANFYFDYGAIGIPSAPNSGGGSTRGVKLQANQTSGIFGGVSVSPNGKSFLGNYVLRFDMWLSFNGPAPVGGSGSTQIGGAGIRTAGATAQWPGGAQDSVWFAATADGNSSVDYRAYSPAAPTGYTAPSGVFAAGTGTSPDARNQTHPYYAGFGNVTAPAAQVVLFPQQTGSTLAGSLGWAWHDVAIKKEGDIISWLIDGLLIATVDSTGMSLGGNNILLTYSDTNATSSTDPNDTALLFGLFDNVRVEVVPEPASGTLALVGGLLMTLVRRRQR